MANATVPAADFYTFVKDIRQFGGGSPVAYRYDPAAIGTEAGDTTTGELKQGEMVAWAHNTSTPSLVRMIRNGGTGNALKYVGITRESAQGVKRLGNQAALTPTELSVFTTGVHNMKTANGITYNEGDVVFMVDGDTTAVNKDASGSAVAVGRVFLPMDPAVVGDGVKRVPVIIDDYTNYSGV
jgi:hypothetical protein